MRLYIGGCFQGKYEYVTKLWEDEHPGRNLTVFDGGQELSERTEVADILDHFHLLVRKLLREDKEVRGYVAEILRKNPDIWIICDEVGMGIVPVDPFERQYREAVGRCCCDLAKEAEQVVRIICGMEERIK